MINKIKPCLYYYLRYIRHICPTWGFVLYWQFFLRTACRETNNAGTLNVSKNISAAFSRLRRGLSGASVSRTGCSSEKVWSWSLLYMYCQIRSMSFQSVTIPCSMGYWRKKIKNKYAIYMYTFFFEGWSWEPLSNFLQNWYKMPNIVYKKITNDFWGKAC